MAHPQVSVIVRTRDKAATVEATLRSIREQTVPSEIVVVDSGSTDGTLEIARRWADRIVEIAPGEFSFGGSLNAGAAVAAGEIHAAVSAHVTLTSTDWLAVALAHYLRDDVAGACSQRAAPDGSLLDGPYYQTLADWAPRWGFSNTAATWRASAWREHPFNERMTACEDKEWAWRVLNAGWTLAYDPRLYVDLGHRQSAGARQLFRRTVAESRESVTYTPTRPLGARDALAMWWNGTPFERGETGVRWRLRPMRVVDVLGQYVGGRQARPRATARAGGAPATPTRGRPER